jgi:hypothetical protein
MCRLHLLQGGGRSCNAAVKHHCRGQGGSAHPGVSGPGLHLRRAEKADRLNGRDRVLCSESQTALIKAHIELK